MIGLYLLSFNCFRIIDYGHIVRNYLNIVRKRAALKWNCARTQTEEIFKMLEFDEKMQESIFTFVIYTEPVWGSILITRAMLNGTPMIAIPLGGSSEYLGAAGMYVPLNGPSTLAVVVRSLREDLGRMVRERVLQYQSWDAIAEKTVRIYQHMLDT